MSEGFKRSKSFLYAAKEAGYNPDERKLIAMDPKLILEGTSEQLREKLTPEMLVSFFNILQNDKTADPKHILNVGNFLYNYRQGRTNKAGDLREQTKIEESDRRALDLACSLLENAFYAGNLSKLPKEQAATLAFTVNVIAKIMEQQQDVPLRGFSAEKLSKFIQNVHVFEQNTLFPQKGEHSTELTAREAFFQDVDKQIKDKIAATDALRPADDWNAYRKELIAGLDKAARTIKDSGINTTAFGELKNLGEIIDVMENRWPEIMRYYEGKVALIRHLSHGKTADEDLSGMDNVRPLLETTANYYFTKAKPAEFIGPDRTFSKIDFIRQFIQRVRAKAEQFTADKKTTYNNMEEAARALKHDKFSEQLSAAADTLENFVGKKIEYPSKNDAPGNLGEYIKGYKEIARHLQWKMFRERLDDLFARAEERLTQKNARVSLPYLIKSYLIVDNMGADRWQGAESELAALTGSYDFNEKFKGAQPVHSFMPDLQLGNTMDTMVDKAPNYSKLHFVADEIPFAVWAKRYLASNSPEKK